MPNSIENSSTAQVIIIGAGPIGLELAVALAKLKVSTLQFDAGQIGQTIMQFPPQTRFFSSTERISIAGVPLQTADQTKCTREEYLTYLRTVVQQFKLRINTYERVTAIDQIQDAQPFRFCVTTTSSAGVRTHLSQHIVIASGGTAFSRKLHIPGETLPHVADVMADPHLYFGKKLLIIGGRNSAVECALRCHHAGAKVSISYRKSQLDTQSIKYWLLPEINGLIKHGAINGYFDTTASEITPSEVKLHRSDGSQVNVATDFVLKTIGFDADMSLCKMAGVELIGPAQSPTFDPATMQTDVPGIYLAGTVTGGTQHRYAIFIENGYVHIDRIVQSICGRAVPGAIVLPTAYEMEES